MHAAILHHNGKHGKFLFNKSGAGWNLLLYCDKGTMEAAVEPISIIVLFHQMYKAKWHIRDTIYHCLSNHQNL